MFKKLKNISLVKALKLQAIQARSVYVIVLAIFILVNLLVAPLSARLDLSAGKAYTLSPASKNILHKLDDVVTIRFFVSSELPARIQTAKADVVDFLNEYKKEGGNKIQLKTIDPKKDATTQTQAQEAGIQELQFNQVEQDKYAVSTGYFGIALSYGSKKESIPQISDLNNLEYNLTSTIYKLTRKDLPKVGLIGEPAVSPQGDPIGTLRKVLQSQFALDTVTIATDSAAQGIDSSNGAVVIFDNDSKEYNPQEIEALKKYVNNKGKAIVFADGIWVTDGLTTTEAKSNLGELVKDWGMTIQNDLILSASAALVNFGSQDASFYTPYPFWLRTNNFNTKASYFSNIQQMTYPWVSSISLNKKDGYDVTELVNTTKQSWSIKGPTIDLNPQKIAQPKQTDLKTFIIAAQSKSKNGGQVVVIPSSRFVQDQYIGQSLENIEFVLNILNDLASGGALAGIRARAVNFYPVPDMPAAQKDTFKYVNMLLLPALFAIYGAWRLVKRK